MNFCGCCTGASWYGAMVGVGSEANSSFAQSCSVQTDEEWLPGMHYQLYWSTK